MQELLDYLNKSISVANEFKDCNMKAELINRINLALSYANEICVMVESCPKG